MFIGDLNYVFMITNTNHVSANICNISNLVKHTVKSSMLYKRVCTITCRCYSYR